MLLAGSNTWSRISLAQHSSLLACTSRIEWWWKWSSTGSPCVEGSPSPSRKWKPLSPHHHTPYTPLPPVRKGLIRWRWSYQLLDERFLDGCTLESSGHRIHLGVSFLHWNKCCPLFLFCFVSESLFGECCFPHGGLCMHPPAIALAWPKSRFLVLCVQRLYRY